MNPLIPDLPRVQTGARPSPQLRRAAVVLTGSSEAMAEGLRVAVVGSGISGLTAAFLLTRHDHRATPDHNMLCMEKHWAARRVRWSTDAGQLRVHGLALEGGSHTTCRPHAWKGSCRRIECRSQTMIVERHSDTPPRCSA